MTERISDPCDEAAALEWIARRQGPGERTFAIDLNGTFIGCIGLSLSGRSAGLGYWLGRSHWNCGYATEAGQAIIVLARGIGLTTIVADDVSRWRRLKGGGSVSKSARQSAFSSGIGTIFSAATRAGISLVHQSGEPVRP